MGPRQPQEDILVHMFSPLKDDRNQHGISSLDTNSIPHATDDNQQPQETPGDNQDIRCAFSTSSGDVERPLVGELQAYANEGVVLEEDGMFRVYSSPLNETQRYTEPSSAIACRIMCAHDNPSPPPFVIQPLPAITSGDEAFQEHMSTHTLCAEVATGNQLAHPNGQTPVITKLSSQKPENDEQDLILFDQSVIIPNEQDSSVAEAQVSHQLQPTVDDLLFSSPTPALVQEDNVGTKLLQTPNAEILRRRSPRLSSVPLPVGHKQEGVQFTPKDDTPSRSRKRRREDGEKLIRLTPSPVKIMWPSDAETSNDETKTLIVRQRRERKRFRKGEDSDMGLCLAGSLSPDSADILSGLVFPAPEEKTTTNKSPPISSSESLGKKDDETELKSKQSPFLSSTPSVTQDLQRPSTPQVGPSASRESVLTPFTFSPTKLALSIATDEPNRTPARRVPIFVPPGTSDNRIASRSINFPPITNTPVFTRPPPNDPNRSPARRVPVAAVHVPHKVGDREEMSPHRTATKSPKGDLQKSTKNLTKIIVKDKRPKAVQGSSTLPMPSGSAGNRADTKPSSSRIPRANSSAKPNSHIRISKLAAHSSKKGASFPLAVSQFSHWLMNAIL